MGLLVRYQNSIAMLLLSAWLSGCAAVAAVSIIPGALIEVVAGQFTGEEESFSSSMESTLAATQLSLRSMKLDVDILEVLPRGEHAIAFGNDRLNGSISLIKQTELLTTIYVKVRRTTREESVERAIVESVRAKLKSISRKTRFQKAGYRNLRKKASIKSAHLGWIRKDALVQAHQSTTPDWLRIKLPSGAVAYMKGRIEGNSNAKRKTDAKQKADARRKAAAKRKIYARQKADTKRKADARRKADAKRKAYARRKADAKRKAIAKRKADARRKADAKRKAYARRIANAKKTK